MNKNKWILAAGMTLGLMLTGCSETVTETAKEEITNNNPDALIDYSTKMEGYMNDFSMTMQEFSDLNMEASQNPSIMSTNEWVTDVSSTLISMEEHIADIRAVTPPDEVEVSHDYVLQAMDSFEYVVNNYPDSLGNSDIMSSCIDALEEGGENLDKAKTELDEITADM